MQSDIDQFEEMIADCYTVFIGTKRTIQVTRQAFALVGVEISSNTILYEVKIGRKNLKAEGKLLLIEDKETKIEILKRLHIL